MLNKIMAAASLFLLILTALLFFLYKLSQSEIKTLVTENKALTNENKTLMIKNEVQKNEIIKFNESQNESQKTIKALRNKANTTAKETCSCYNMPIDDVFLELLPKSKQ